ncbi:MAG: M3 family oligoendopeptidase, partial [Candidatus Heimdallarchaeaceae archaeon]
YQLYLEKGKEYFIPRYKKLLSSGGSATPQEMLKEFEIDLKDAEFWKKGLKYLESKIDELEKLIQ